MTRLEELNTILHRAYALVSEELREGEAASGEVETCELLMRVAAAGTEAQLLSRVLLAIGQRTCVQALRDGVPRSTIDKALDAGRDGVRCLCGNCSGVRPEQAARAS